MIRKTFVYLVLLFLLTGQYPSTAQIAISFLAGPNYSYFIQSKSDYAAKASPGIGLDAGLQFKAGDNHLLSFKAFIGYSLQTPGIKLPNFVINEYYRYTYLEGKYQLSNILIHPQLQFNFLKKKDLFLGIGPFCQVRIAGYGKGTYSYGFSPGGLPYSGDEILRISTIFNKWNYGPGISFGYQKICFGKICLFFELRELWMINNYFQDDNKSNGWSSKAVWYNLMTSLNVGLDFYRK